MHWCVPCRMPPPPCAQLSLKEEVEAGFARRGAKQKGVLREQAECIAGLEAMLQQARDETRLGGSAATCRRDTTLAQWGAR
jgi:hypothetical protein